MMSSLDAHQVRPASSPWQEDGLDNHMHRQALTEPVRAMHRHAPSQLAAVESASFQGAGTSSGSHSHTPQSRSMHIPSSGQKGQSQYRLTLKYLRCGIQEIKVSGMTPLWDPEKPVSSSTPSYSVEACDMLSMPSCRSVEVVQPGIA